MSNPEKLSFSPPSPEKGAPSLEEHTDSLENDRVLPEEDTPLPEEDIEIEGSLRERAMAAIREIKRQHAEKIVKRCLYGAITFESLAIPTAIVTNSMILKEFADKLVGYETAMTGPSHAARVAIVIAAIAATAGSIIGPAFISYLNSRRQELHG